MELSARAAYRGQVTKIVKSAGEYLTSDGSQLNGEDAFDGIEEELVTFIQRLTAALESVIVTNQEIKTKDLIKADDWERDLEKVAEYEDAAIGMLARLNSRLKKLRRKLNPIAMKSDEDSRIHNTSAVISSSTKLQKLPLKKFDGHFQQWLPFWEQFRTAVHENNSLTSSDKFSYLESVLVGNAKKVISGFTASEVCYDAAISLLQEQFGDTERLVDKYMQELVSLRPIHSRTDVASLRNLYNAITTCSRTLTALQVPTHQYYIMLKTILLRCLPVELRIDFHRTAERDNDIGETDSSSKSSSSTLSQIGDKQVQGIMRFLKREVESLEKSRVVPVTANSKQSTSTTATSLVSMSNSDKCLFCVSDQHDTKECDANIPISQKRDKLRTSGRCFRCTKRGHSSKKCRSAKFLSCKKCKGKHLTSLCDPSYIGKSEKILVPMAVNKDNNQNALNLCACNSKLENTNVFLKTARGIAVAPSKEKSTLIRFIIDGGSQHSYILESLVQKLSLVSIGEVNMSVIPFGSKEKSPSRILHKVKIAIESQFSKKRVYVEAVVVPEICVDVLPAPESSCFSFHGLRLADSHHVAMDTEDGLSVLVGSDYYWSVVTGKQKHITQSLRAVETMMSNRQAAKNRLCSLTRQLSRVPGRLSEYDKALRQMVSDGIAEPVGSDGEESSKRIFYLPLHPVYKAESTTTKMRIVFDASFRTEEVPSLNDQLYVGANLLPDVLKVLLNFRLGRFGIVSDVEKAFLQIALNKNDRDSYRFIWYSNAPPTFSGTSEFTDFRMTRVTFGVNCSPFLLTATLQLHLSNEKQRFHSTVEILKDGFYMDDLVISVDSEDEGKRICDEAVTIMKNASMNLRKWNSNSAGIRKVFGSAETPAVQKVLGMMWFTLSDEIAVSIESVENLLTSNITKGTKRIVLQTIARIYDPLGILGPAVVKVKILFQAIWKKKLGWDEALSAELLSEWDECVKSLMQLKNIAIPRSALSYSTASIIHIHIFADASMKAYGTVAYIKNTNSNGESKISFLCAKSRVAPLREDGTKELTLPKLELTAALIASRLCVYLKRFLKLPVQKFCMWTDSRIALNWIQGEVDRWKPYVQSRVAEIRRHTLAADWKHCSGKENPADLLTRGITAENLRTSSLWAKGPVWLTNEENALHKNIKTTPIIAGPLISLTENHAERMLLDPIIFYEDFSTWDRLLRVSCYVLRFINFCKRKSRLGSILLSADELNVAQTYWLRYIQFKHFTDEFILLQKAKPLSGTSKIAQFSPFLDDDGLLRLGGRLQSLDESFEIKHPIILPTNSHITCMIIKDAHQRSLHGGVNIVLTQLRSRFWIPKGRQLVKKVLKRCVTCRKLWGKPASQPFGPLPVERITLSRPFENIGIDFAGPLYCFRESDGVMAKSYLMVITCAAIRAIHLELVPSMSTESCLMGLRCFIARRGVPSIIYSDNARTFRRAALELGESSFKDDYFQNFLSDKRIRWKFIVEQAPWWGGFWERLIRSIKNILKVVIGKAKLTFEQLRTIITEAEGMVNARPLTYISCNPLDVAPLTPAHFLLNSQGCFNMQNLGSESAKIQSLWQQRLRYSKMLWNRWRTEYMQLLRSFHHSKNASSVDLKKNDVVLVFNPGKPRIHWRLAVVEDTFVGRDNKVRACQIRYSDGIRTRRPVQLLYPLELPISSPVGGC